MCVCLSVTRQYCIEKAAQIELLFIQVSPTYATVCFSEIRVSPDIRVLPSGTLSQTLNLENFAMAH